MNILTGMHRSGTSFLAQLLHLLGADFGNPDLLFRADKWNQNGYFENMEILDINNRMILGQNARIDFWLYENEKLVSRVKNCFMSYKWKYIFFPSLDRIQNRGKAHINAIKRIHREYKKKFVKDPRFCLTLDAWRQLGPIENLVFIYRHPSLVAGSLARRDRLPLFIGYNYWLYHIQNFFRQLQDGDKLFIVDFDAFFDINEQNQAVSNISACLTGDSLGQDEMSHFRNVLNSRLRTQTEPRTPPKKRIREVYEALTALRSNSNGIIRVYLQSEIIRRITGK